ncbi:uncharacterized protein FFB20_14870 [Fusarium fujikuroi]|nr:uncharacterized protein FFB20_14870 [Fusarium fujikuroi]SCO20706.1 uncharacterized protein FFC1_13813 [Fusarium fujikuroi]SCO45511.1 uncharacterized protein FFNC_10333 [Fusarium fujikuroi]
MPIMSDDEVRALAAQVKQQRIEIDALKKIIGALIMEADLGDTGMKGGLDPWMPKDEVNFLNGSELSDAGFVEKGALLLKSKQPAFLLPLKFFDLFAHEAVMINGSQNPSDNNAGN